MAPFLPQINPTNDPNYLNQSRGYSDVKPNMTMSSLFSGVAGLVNDVKPLEDALVHDRIQQPLEKELAGIVDSKGGDITPQEVPAIAGTGGRGSRYAAASASGIPGATDDIAAEPALPGTVANGLSGLKRMKAAYDQGELSETKFRAEVEAAAKKYRSTFPEYADKIDQITSSYLGTSPANKVRESILRDMMSMSAAANSAQNKALAYVQKHENEIGALYPGKSTAWAVQNINEVMNNPQVLQLASQNARYAWNKANWETIAGVPKADAAKVYLREEGDGMVRGMIQGSLNVANVDFKSILGSISNPQKMTPDQISDAVFKLQAAEDAARQAFRAKASARDPNNPKSESYASRLTPTELLQMEDSVVSPITTIREGISKNRWDVVSIAANMNKLQQDQDQRTLFNLFPEIRSMAALTKAAGNTPLPATVMESLLGNKDKLNQIITGGWMNTQNVNSPTPAPGVDDVAEATKMSGSDILKYMNVQKALLNNPDPEVQKRAIDSLYGSVRTFDRLSDSDKKIFYAKLGDPSMTEKARRLGPQSFLKYYNFMEKAFTSVARNGISDLQEAVKDTSVTGITLNPKTLQFDIRSNVRPSPTGTDMGARFNYATGERRPVIADPLQTRADELNLSISMFEPALRARWGDQAIQHMTDLIVAGGVNFNAPKESFLGQMGKAISDALRPERGPSAYPKQKGEATRLTGSSSVFQPETTIPSSNPVRDPFNTRTSGKEQDRLPVGPQGRGGMQRLDDGQAQNLQGVQDVLTRLGVKIDPEAWEKMLSESPDGNVEDRRGEGLIDPEEALNQAKAAYNAAKTLGAPDDVLKQLAKEVKAKANAWVDFQTELTTLEDKSPGYYPIRDTKMGRDLGTEDIK